MSSLPYFIFPFVKRPLKCCSKVMFLRLIPYLGVTPPFRAAVGLR